MDAVRPSSLKELMQYIASKENIAYVAGGTDFIPKFIDREFDLYVSLLDVKEMLSFEERDGYLFIGASLPYNSYVENLKGKYNALYEAISQIGSEQIRNIATIGGNIANASPAGDTLPVLLAYDSVVVLYNGEYREIKMRDFFKGPGITSKEKKELVIGVKVPLEKCMVSRFLKVGVRAAMTVSKVSLAICYNKEGSTLKDVSIALGSVAPKPLYAIKTSDFLNGKMVDKKIISKARDIIMEEVQPIDDIRSEEFYRRQVAGNLLVKVLNTL